MQITPTLSTNGTKPVTTRIELRHRSGRRMPKNATNIQGRGHAERTIRLELPVQQKLCPVMPAQIAIQPQQLEPRRPHPPEQKTKLNRLGLESRGAIRDIAGDLNGKPTRQTHSWARATMRDAPATGAGKWRRRGRKLRIQSGPASV